MIHAFEVDTISVNGKHAQIGCIVNYALFNYFTAIYQG